MTSIKKICINSSKHYYTGAELSPLHYGLSAEGYELNSVMEGYDKELWFVDIKNNKKVWIKNDTIIRITREDPIINDIEHIPTKNDINEQIINIMNSNKTHLDNKKIVNQGEEKICQNNDTLSTPILDNINLDKNKKSTDYNIFVKYRLNQLKDINKNKKDNFNNVKNEWHELKKNVENLRNIMSSAKIWYAETLK